jgi:hypothetical protein
MRLQIAVYGAEAFILHGALPQQGKARVLSKLTAEAPAAAIQRLMQAKYGAGFSIFVFSRVSILSRFHCFAES